MTCKILRINYMRKQTYYFFLHSNVYITIVACEKNIFNTLETFSTCFSEDGSVIESKHLHCWLAIRLSIELAWQLNREFTNNDAAAWRRGCLTTRLLDDAAAWRRGCLTTRLLDDAAAWRRGCLTTRLLDDAAAWRRGCLTTRLLDDAAAWRRGCLTTRLLDDAAAWRRGCLTTRLQNE